MKSIGVTWLIRLFEHISNNPCNIVNGFLAAGISQSIDGGKPVTVGVRNNDDIDSSDQHDDDDSSAEYSNSDDESD